MENLLKTIIMLASVLILGFCVIGVIRIVWEMKTVLFGYQ